MLKVVIIKNIERPNVEQARAESHRNGAQSGI